MQAERERRRRGQIRCDRRAFCWLNIFMAPKTLRVVRDSKYSGSFTRQQIERAIRTVERTREVGPSIDKRHGDHSARSTKSASRAKG